MKTVMWFLSHPLWATCHLLTGRPWSHWFNFWGDLGSGPCETCGR